MLPAILLCYAVKWRAAASTSAEIQPFEPASRICSIQPPSHHIHSRPAQAAAGHARQRSPLWLLHPGTKLGCNHGIGVQSVWQCDPLPVSPNVGATEGCA